MNYRHAFHAGNFADVLKHIVLALVLKHLAQKDTPFRVIDTHAGIGLYDLAGEQAARTGEWHGGFGRIDGRPLAGPAQAALAPWLEAVAEARQRFGPGAYPGSPLLAAMLTRAQDRLVFVEKHPDDVRTLAAALGRDRRAKVVELDGWMALKAYVPPPERRGLVLVDPPFEAPDEFARMAAAAHAAWVKWPTGTYLLWYPVKDPAGPARFVADLAERGVRRMLRLELHRCAPGDPRHLAGSGLLVVNPPWTLAETIRAALPALAERLATGPGAGWRCDEVAGEG